MSSVVTWSVRRSRLSSWAASSASSTISGQDHPMDSASSVHRVVRSATPIPLFLERVSTAASLVSAARSHCDGSRPCRCDELVDLRPQRCLDFGGALGEQPEDVLRDACDLGLAVLDGFPLEAEAVREVVAEHGLIDAAEHSLVLLHVGAVECEPSAVAGTHLVRDHRVGVEVGVVGARCGLAELGDRETVGVGVEPLLGALSDAGRRAEAFEVCERRGHRRVVRIEEPLVLRERPEDADRLRRGERGVEAGDSALDAPVAHRAVTERPSERRLRYGVTGFEEREQIVLRDVAGEAEVGGLVAGPDPRHLAGCLGQVVGVVLRRGRCTAGVDGGHAQHLATRSRLGTCLNFPTATGGARHDMARDLRPTTAGRAGGRGTALDEAARLRTACAGPDGATSSATGRRIDGATARRYAPAAN